MKVRIDAATRDHAADIALITAEALSAHIDVDSPRVHKILSEGLTYVAIVDGSVVGFVDSFIIVDAARQRRFELDLLAVSPAVQGRGIGSLLVAESLSAARQFLAANIRTLVRCENYPMQRICGLHGFEQSGHSYQLYVSAAQAIAEAVSQDHRARLIPVDTLTYSGYWLEGELSQSAINEARSSLLSRGCNSRMGAVIATHDTDTIELLRTNSFDLIGKFDWWSINLRSGRV